MKQFITLDGREVKVGDRLWSFLHGWGEVTGFISSQYPIAIKFEGLNAVRTLTKEGKITAEESRVLFWDEIKFEIPKPKKKELRYLFAYEYDYKKGNPEISKGYYKDADDFSNQNSSAIGCQRLSWTVKEFEVD